MTTSNKEYKKLEARLIKIIEKENKLHYKALINYAERNDFNPSDWLSVKDQKAYNKLVKQDEIICNKL